MAYSGLRYPGSFNSYVPKVTGQVVSFIRDPEKFRLNQYCQLVKSEAKIGVYYKLEADQWVRDVNTDEWAWEDGADRPKNRHNQLRFATDDFQCIRRNFGTQIGWETIEQADWKVLEAHTVMARSQAMTDNTYRVAQLLDTSGNWPASNTAAANTLNGGKGRWDLSVSDPANAAGLAIKRSLDEAARRIHLLTNGQIDDKDDAGEPTLRLVISPAAALKISQTDEIHSYIRESPYALDQIKGRKEGQNAKWGLPDYLYGFKIIVETANYVTERPKASGVEAIITTPFPRKYIKDDDSAWILSRPGGLDGQIGAPSFSTVQLYYYGSEIEVEVEDDKWNRLTKVGVVVNNVPKLPAPQSGFLITDILT